MNLSNRLQVIRAVLWSGTVVAAFGGCWGEPSQPPPASSSGDETRKQVSAPADSGRKAIVPGHEQRRFDLPVQGEYARLDPGRDGWQSEALQAAAKTQLGAIKAFLARQESAREKADGEGDRASDRASDGESSEAGE